MRTKKRKWSIGFFVLCFSCGLLSLFYGCEKSNDDIPLEKTEKSLNLIAPSGEKIADNVLALKKKVADFIAERYGVDKKFEIRGLQYLPLSKGYSVLIDYKTKDGIIGNLGIANNSSKVVFKANEIMGRISNRNARVKTRSETSGGDSEVTYSCKPSSKSPEKCECKLTIQYHADTGVYEYSCKENAENCECELETVYG